MSVNILANLSVLMVSIVFFVLMPKKEGLDTSLTRRVNLIYIMVVSVFCILLLYCSVVLDGVNFDYRFLMYALMIRYLGPMITLPSILIVTVYQFFFVIEGQRWISFGFGVIMIITLTHVNKILAKRTNDYWCIILISLYELGIRTGLNVFSKQEPIYSKSIYLIVASSGILMILAFIWFIKRITRLNEQHYYDYLTQLKNSRRFYLDLSKPIKPNDSLTIAILDIDYFKMINDNYGHLAGDNVLVQISQLFQSLESEKIYFYRLGGEEFACVMYPPNTKDPQDFMEIIRKTVEQAVIQVPEGNSLAVTVSIGMAQLGYGEEIFQAINQADQALYAAKKAGRNCVSMSREDDQDYV